MLATLRARKARSFVLENVAKLAAHKQGRTLKNVLKQLDKTGYRVDAMLYDSAHFGLPQFLVRLYIIGVRDDIGLQPELPEAPDVERPLLSSFLDAEYGKKGAKPRPTKATARRNLKLFKRTLRRNN